MWIERFQDREGMLACRIQHGRHLLDRRKNYRRLVDRDQPRQRIDLRSRVLDERFPVDLFNIDSLDRFSRHRSVRTLRGRRHRALKLKALTDGSRAHEKRISVVEIRIRILILPQHEAGVVLFSDHLE